MNTHPVSRRVSAHPVRSCDLVVDRARIVLALGNAPQRFLIQEMFQSQGWEVLVVSCPREARRFARKRRTVVTLLADEPARYESGWLTCRKILLDRPTHRVVIVGTRATYRAHEFAKFVGAAAYLPLGAGEHAIAKAVTGVEMLCPV